MKCSSKALLDLEGNSSSPSSIESALLVCKNKDPLLSQTTKPHPPVKKPSISTVPKSQVLGKVQDFLGVIAVANKRLQLDAKDNTKDHDIEVLTGTESEYIEMDLMLGIADLHTPEAVAAAESTISGYQPVIPLAGSSSEAQSDDSSDETDDYRDHDNNDDNETCCPQKFKRSKCAEDDSSNKAPGNQQSKKRPKILELS